MLRKLLASALAVTSLGALAATPASARYYHPHHSAPHVARLASTTRARISRRPITRARNSRNRNSTSPNGITITIATSGKRAHRPAGATIVWLKHPRRATSGQATKSRKSFDRQMRASCKVPRKHVTAIMPGRRRGLAAMKARCTSSGDSVRFFAGANNSGGSPRRRGRRARRRNSPTGSCPNRRRARAIRAGRGRHPDKGRAARSPLRKAGSHHDCRAACNRAKTAAKAHARRSLDGRRARTGTAIFARRHWRKNWATTTAPTHNNRNRPMAHFHAARKLPGAGRRNCRECSRWRPKPASRRKSPPRPPKPSCQRTAPVQRGG